MPSIQYTSILGVIGLKVTRDLGQTESATQHKSQMNAEALRKLNPKGFNHPLAVNRGFFFGKFFSIELKLSKM